MSKSFAIVGHARSGSSSLKRLLELHGDITIESEPFNPKRYLWKYPFDYQGIVDAEGLSGCLHYLYERFNGIKHLYEHLNTQDNQTLINYVDRVIFLYRKDVLQAAVSLAMSQQTQHWSAGQHPEDHVWQPLDANLVEHVIHQLHQFQKHIQTRYHNIDHIVVEHDELYGEHSADTKLARMTEMLTFLERKPITHPRLLQQCAAILDRENKTSTEDIYHRIPNIMEIEEHFGNEINGYLFNRTTG